MLISYVFATPGEEYRGSDLLTLNLNQYLWKSLHRDFHTVYFLDSQDGCTFSVHTFGDRDAKRYKPPIFSSVEKRFGDWLLEQLCLPQDAAAAFVCPMDVFCRVFSRDSWASVLERIASATGCTGIFVLTASPYAEDSRELLLTSPVFDRLRETAVTENRSQNRCIYTALREEKPRHYCTLNSFTKERLDDLLLHICAADPDRCPDPEVRQTYAKNLADYLRSGQPLPWITAASQQSLYLTYRELYQQLCRRDAWEQMTHLPPQFSSPEPPAILRRPDCCAGKCMKLQLPDWALGKRDSNGRSPEAILEDIRKALCASTNRLEVPELAKATGVFLQRFKELRPGDLDTCTLLLDALKFCADWTATCPEDPQYQAVRRILDKLMLYTKNSAGCFSASLALAKQEAAPLPTSQERLALQRYKEKLEKKWTTLRNCVAILKVTMMNLVLSDDTDCNDLLDVYFNELHDTEIGTVSAEETEDIFDVPLTFY